MQTALIIAIPTFTVLLSIIFRHRDFNALRADVVTLRYSLNREMGRR